MVAEGTSTEQQSIAYQGPHRHSTLAPSCLTLPKAHNRAVPFLAVVDPARGHVHDRPKDIEPCRQPPKLRPSLCGAARDRRLPGHLPCRFGVGRTAATIEQPTCGHRGKEPRDIVETVVDAHDHSRVVGKEIENRQRTTRRIGTR
jgi:hypothetical protein